MVRADSEAAVTLTFENEPLLAKPDDVAAEYVCADGLDAAGAPLGYGRFQPVPCAIRDNTLTVTVRFRGETEHTIRVIQKSSDPKKPNVLGVARCTPCVGLLRAAALPGQCAHAQQVLGRHKTNRRPDGRHLRKLGHDFAIETDHRAYAGSLDAIAAFF
jgi:hypothetical protein